MARSTSKRGRTGTRAVNPLTRFAPTLATLEDRSVPALIYVDLGFTDGGGGNPAQPFNPAGTGPLGTVAAAGLTFVAPGDSAAVTGDGSFATSDLTTAFNAARDNPGADTILLAPGSFALDNSQGKSATLNPGVGFNDNTYFFNADPLTILGSGLKASAILPQVSTYDPAVDGTESDPVFAVRAGAAFVASDFAFDGSAGKFGVGIGVSGGTAATLTRVAVRNIVGEDGSTTGGGTFGFGLAANDNTGGSLLVQQGEFGGNARAGVAFLNSDGQVLASTFTGRGDGDLVDYGVQALGSSNVAVTGSRFTGYFGKASSDGTRSAAIFGAAETQGGAGAGLLVVGNAITGNRVGVILGSSSSNDDASKAVVRFNDLSGNTGPDGEGFAALDATLALAGAGVVTGVQAGIDGRDNFYGGTGPDRDASTGSDGDATTNPDGTGSAAVGNVRIDGFRSAAVPALAVSTPFGKSSADLGVTGGAAAGAVASVLTGPLTIYVDRQFVGVAGSANPSQDFNAASDADGTSRGGPLGTTAKGGLTFVPTLSPGVPLIPEGGVVAGAIAVNDLTAAFNLARDVAGKDTIFLAADKTPYALLNEQGGSLAASYFFEGDNGLTLSGSGAGASVIRPTASTFLPDTDPDDPQLTAFDPVLAFRTGAGLAGSGFTLDGSLAKFGGGIGVSGGTTVTLTGVALRNFVGQDGSAPAENGFTSGYGLFVNPNPGGTVTVTDSQFSGNGRIGVGFQDATGQVLGSTFTGRGAGNLVDYGVQAFGASKAYISGSRFGGYLGKAAADDTESAAVNGTDGAELLIVGNSIVGNRIGVAVGSTDAAASSAKAEVRFNDLSGNGRSIDALQAAAGPGAVVAPNNFFGDPAGPTPTGSPVAANGGNVGFRAAADTVDVFRPVTAPVLAIANGFAADGGLALAAAAAQAATAYVTDPRIQAEVTLTAPALTAGQPAVVTLTVVEPLAVRADGTFAFDPTRIGVAYTVNGATTTLDPARYTVSAPSADGRSVTVTIPPDSLTTLPGYAPGGLITVTAQPSSSTAQTGNLQLTASGRQTGGPETLVVQYGAVTPPPAGAAPTVTLTTLVINGATVAPTNNQTISTTGGSVATFTVTPAAGATVTSVTATSSNPAFTVTQSGTLENPVFTVTGSPAQAGQNTVVTVTATDSAGRTTTVPYFVSVPPAPTPPAGAAPVVALQSLAINGAAVSPTNNQTIPLGGTSAATFTVTPAAGATIASVAATSSNPAFTVSVSGPNTAPVVTVTGPAGQVGNTVVTVTATDSAGRVTSVPYFVQVAAPAATTIAINTLTLDGRSVTPTPNQQIATGGTSVATFTVTPAAGLTVTTTATSSNPAVATVAVTGSATSPTVTVTGVPGQSGVATITVTATDSLGRTQQFAYSVQVGTPVTPPVVPPPTVTGLADVTIPFNGASAPQTVTLTGTGTLTVVGTSSNPGVATVEVTGTGTARTVVVRANPALTAGGTAEISLRVTDAQGQSAVTTFTVTVAAARTRLFAAGAGPGSSPVVQVYGQNGVKLFGATAFELSFTGGVVVATGDINGDGYDDVVMGADGGGGPRVRILDGKTGVELANFFAFEESFRGGVTVAVAKVLNTGVNAAGYFREQLIVGAGSTGGPRVSVFDYNPATRAVTRTANFFAYEESFRGGVNVAGGDLNGDGLAEIVTGAGVGGGARVRAFNAAGGSAGVDFFAFDSAGRDGVSVAVGQLDGTGKAAIITGGVATVRVFNPAGTSQTAQFTPYPEPTSKGLTVRVGAAQYNPTGGESIVTGPGLGGGAAIKVFPGSNPAAGASFADFAFEAPFRGGIFVG